MTENSVEPADGIHGIKVFSTDLLVEEGRPLQWKGPESDGFVWRETLETTALCEFLSDVAWGDLALLLIDLPPGSARITDLAALVPELDGVIAVTIPSEESRRSVERSLHRVRESEVRIIGIVENMSGYLCPECGLSGSLFSGDAGDRLADQFGVPLLGRIPFSPSTEDPPGSGRADAQFRVPELPETLIERLLEAGS
jgi:ATP-binding protein involved in chromosome partitioning